MAMTRDTCQHKCMIKHMMNSIWQRSSSRWAKSTSQDTAPWKGKGSWTRIKWLVLMRRLTEQQSRGTSSARSLTKASTRRNLEPFFERRRTQFKASTLSTSTFIPSTSWIGTCRNSNSKMQILIRVLARRATAMTTGRIWSTLRRPCALGGTDLFKYRVASQRTSPSRCSTK